MHNGKKNPNDFSKDLCHYEQVHSKCDISIYNWAISTDYKIKLVVVELLISLGL